MNVGLPGTGIGAAFYLASIVIMFGVELVLAIRRRALSLRARQAFKLALILAGIILSLLALDIYLDVLLAEIATEARSSGSAPNSPATFFAAEPVLVTFTTLTVVIGIVAFAQMLDRSDARK